MLSKVRHITVLSLNLWHCDVLMTAVVYYFGFKLNVGHLLSLEKYQLQQALCPKLVLVLVNQ
jgi:hypothetical protein